MPSIRIVSAASSGVAEWHATVSRALCRVASSGSQSVISAVRASWSRAFTSSAPSLAPVEEVHDQDDDDETSCISGLLCAVVARWAEVLDRVSDDGVGVVGVQRDRVRDLFAAVPHATVVGVPRAASGGLDNHVDQLVVPFSDTSGPAAAPKSVVRLSV